MSRNRENNPVLGFDLGTTFSSLSRWVDGKGPEIIQNLGGEDATQSVVFYNPDTGEVLVGKTAYHRGLLTPENMIVGVKRLMDDGNQEIVLGGRTFTPIELSAHILNSIYEDAQAKYPQGDFASRGSVVTVPFYFKAHQIESTRRAADLAEIHCIGIIQEPIAASLSYAFQVARQGGSEEFEENILVFDLGGGTFDLTLFSLKNDGKRLLYDVLATDGDDRLGGMDFDQELADLILKKSGISLKGLDPKTLHKAHRNLIEQAIIAKIALSESKECIVAIPFVLPDAHIEVTVTREDFERTIAHHLAEIDGIVERLWAKSGVKSYEVDRVIRVGGSSRIPCVLRLVDDIVGKEKIWPGVDPITCVADGAAMYAAYLDDRRFFGKKLSIQTRTCHALGIKTGDNHFNEIIPANKKTPCEVRHLFTTSEDGVTALDIEVYQGSGRVIHDVTHSHVGTLSLTGLPKRRAGDLEIEICFRLNEEQLLSVTVAAEGKRKTESFTYISR